MEAMIETWGLVALFHAVVIVWAIVGARKEMEND
jgi:hypothetical protein